MRSESTAIKRQHRWKWRIMVVSFFFISLCIFLIDPTSKTLLQPLSTLWLSVRRFPIPSLLLLCYPFWTSLSDVQLNVLQKLLANFPVLGDRHLCSSLILGSICLYAPMTICFVVVVYADLTCHVDITDRVPRNISILSRPQSRSAWSPLPGPMLSGLICTVWCSMAWSYSLEKEGLGEEA